MDVDPDPPKRPRRVALDVLLVVGAILALTGFLGFAIAFNASSAARSRFRELVGNSTHVLEAIGWGLPSLALLLLVLSLVARSRQR